MATHSSILAWKILGPELVRLPQEHTWPYLTTLFSVQETSHSELTSPPVPRAPARSTLALSAASLRTSAHKLTHTLSRTAWKLQGHL